MKPTLINLYDENPLIKSITKENNYKFGKITLHDFPDEETHIKIENSLQDREVITLNSLDKPNRKILPLLFIAERQKKLVLHELVCALLIHPTCDKINNSNLEKE